MKKLFVFYSLLMFVGHNSVFCMKTEGVPQCMPRLKNFAQRLGFNKQATASFLKALSYPKTTNDVYFLRKRYYCEQLLKHPISNEIRREQMVYYGAVPMLYAASDYYRANDNASKADGIGCIADFWRQAGNLYDVKPIKPEEYQPDKGNPVDKLVLLAPKIKPIPKVAPYLHVIQHVERILQKKAAKGGMRRYAQLAHISCLPWACDNKMFLCAMNNIVQAHPSEDLLYACMQKYDLEKEFYYFARKGSKEARIMLAQQCFYQNKWQDSINHLCAISPKKTSELYVMYRIACLMDSMSDDSKRFFSDEIHSVVDWFKELYAMNAHSQSFFTFVNYVSPELLKKIEEFELQEPNHSSAQLLLGFLYYRQQDNDRACKQFIQAGSLGEELGKRYAVMLADKTDCIEYENQIVEWCWEFVKLGNKEFKQKLMTMSTRGSCQASLKILELLIADDHENLFTSIIQKVPKTELLKYFNTKEFQKKFDDYELYASNKIGARVALLRSYMLYQEFLISVKDDAKGAMEFALLAFDNIKKALDESIVTKKDVASFARDISTIFNNVQQLDKSCLWLKQAVGYHKNQKTAVMLALMDLKSDKSSQTEKQEAIDELYTSAKEGNEEHQLLCGKAYAEGTYGIKKDPIKAFELYNQY